MRRADLALIQAKRMNRGAMIYTPDLEPILQSPDEAEESRHRATLATALARAVDAKDAYTHSHCETVAELCAMIGHELGLDASHLSRLRLAGLLHDVGKIGITDSILHKPGPLTAEEYEVMKAHPKLGHDIVVAAERHDEARWILHHHERIDGAGYPAGLSGDRIPLESRIILVADAFEAITADRPTGSTARSTRRSRSCGARQGRSSMRAAWRPWSGRSATAACSPPRSGSRRPAP